MKTKEFYCTYAAKMPEVPGRVFDREYRGELDVKAKTAMAAKLAVINHVRTQFPRDEVLWVEVKEF